MPGVVRAQSLRPLQGPPLQKSWVVYAKRTFGGPGQVFNYLGRYTHRVAISNQRLLSIEGDAVRFVTRGAKTATLAPGKFIGRFLQHVLPGRFVKIRHFGILAAGNVNTRLASARQLLEPENALVLQPSTPALALPRCPSPPLLSWRERLILLTGVDPMRCENCGGIKARFPLPPTPKRLAPLDSS